jgi:hypothetical protein
MKRTQPDCDVTLALRTCDDEERIGHALSRWSAHLSALGLSTEILVADEGSGDNTLAVVAMLRQKLADLQVVHVSAPEGLKAAGELARGRIVIFCDARINPPLSALGLALERIRHGTDVVAVSGRYLVTRRTRAWRAFDALCQRRDPKSIERRFLRRASALGLSCAVTARERRSGWAAIRQALRAPLAVFG